MAKTLDLIGVGGARRYVAKDGTYNEAWTAAESTAVSSGFGQYFASNDYVIYRGTNKVDTRVIPVGANIVSATITFTLDYNGTSTDFDLVIQLLAPVSEVPDPTWYNKAYFSGDGGSVNTSGISGTITIPFDETGLGWIQKEDYTKLGIRSSRDIAGTQPSGLEYFTYSGYIHYNIIYTAVPEVTTTKSDEVDDNSANIYYTLVDDHDDAHCDKRGVCYNKTGNPTVADDKVEIEGNFGGVSNYITALTGLDSGTKYYFRPYLHNVTGYGYGTEDDFTTTGVVAEVTTQAVTNIVYDYALGNGTIVAGTDITERGFEVRLDYGAYKDSQNGSLGDYVFHSVAGFDGTVTWDIVYGWNGVLTKTITEENGFGTGAFTGDLAKQPYPMYYNTLFKCESYTCRAYMIADGTTYYGDYVAFDTLCEDAPPADDISDGNPVEPIIPIEPDLYPPFEWEEPEIEYPPFILPDLPSWEFPDYPPMSFVGDFYYRKPYTKKDLDDLRKKCIIYSKNSIEFALVLRHNMNVLRGFFNVMTDYMSKEEFNDFTDLIPPQRLKELYLDPLDPTDFRDIINGFIRNTIDNNIAVNRNFKLIQDGLSDYETESDDAYFKEINSNIKTVTEDDPDVHRLKRKIDNLNQEVAFNFNNIMRNLKIIRARLL